MGNSRALSPERRAWEMSSKWQVVCPRLKSAECKQTSPESGHIGNHSSTLFDRHGLASLLTQDIVVGLDTAAVVWQPWGRAQITIQESLCSAWGSEFLTQGSFLIGPRECSMRRGQFRGGVALT